MKNAYTSPVTKTFLLHTAQMVMASTVGVSADNYSEGMTDLGRSGGDVWDDEAE